MSNSNKFWYYKQDAKKHKWNRKEGRIKSSINCTGQDLRKEIKTYINHDMFKMYFTRKAAKDPTSVFDYDMDTFYTDKAVETETKINYKYRLRPLDTLYVYHKINITILKISDPDWNQTKSIYIDR